MITWYPIDTLKLDTDSDPVIVYSLGNWTCKDRDEHWGMIEHSGYDNGVVLFGEHYMELDELKKRYTHWTSLPEPPKQEGKQNNEINPST